MEKRIVKFGYKLHISLRVSRGRVNQHFSVERVNVVDGVNSKVDEKTHFLMWDFDGKDYAEVVSALAHAQALFDLPTISIISTGRENCYHGYCFKTGTLQQIASIILLTPGIDLKYLGIALQRGYFTLRYSDAGGFKFTPAGELPSDVPADIDYSDVNSFVKYTKPVNKRG